ncbi:MAG: leucine-rich repeat domain-containing protein [Opitutaceae bacterium]
MKFYCLNRVILRWAIYLLVCIPSVLSAAEFGDFTYEIVDGTSVTITAYSDSGPSDVVIPAEIETLPVTSIGDGVFHVSRYGPYRRSSITSINIPNSVTSIGDRAFYSCDDLTSISIPSSVTSIGESAFYRTGLTSVEIPSSVTSIGGSVFGLCTSLTSITVAPGSAAYSSINGALYNLTQTSLIQVPATETGAYSIPSSVTVIGYGAFMGCFNLTSVSIPNNLTSIENFAFRNSGLTSISFPSSLDSIGLGAFDNCGNLTSFTVEPGNLTYSSMDGVLFNLSQSILLLYPNGKIGPYIIPSSVTSIGDRAFYSSDLTSISIPTSVTSIGGSAFYSCGNLTSLSIPGSVSSIGGSAFSYCDGLTSISIASGVTSIGDDAFRSCDGLTSVSIPGTVTSIGDYAFYYCEGLTSVTLADGVMEIGSNAFQSCDGLTSITIPGSVTSIGSYAFFFCTNLTSTYFLGDAPASIDSSAFGGTSSSHTIYYFDTSTGFTSPTWNGEPTEMVDTLLYPAAPWLVTANVPHDTALDQDHNGDGVSLLMSYALNLNPNNHPVSELPQAELTVDTLQMEFYGSTPGISYQVKASQDLTDWETIVVDLSEPDVEGLRTATIPLTANRGFLKLVVEEQ